MSSLVDDPRARIGSGLTGADRRDLLRPSSRSSWPSSADRTRACGRYRSGCSRTSLFFAADIALVARVRLDQLAWRGEVSVTLPLNAFRRSKFPNGFEHALNLSNVRDPGGSIPALTRRAERIKTELASSSPSLAAATEAAYSFPPSRSFKRCQQPLMAE
jgi:hypothetical protein